MDRPYDLDNAGDEESPAQRRDHRFWGKRLELFHFEPSAAGMPYWLPNGLKILNRLIAFSRSAHEENGYQEIASPLVNEKRLWEISGHWQQYRDNMFVMPESEDVVYGLKPMNCPNAMIVYGLKLRSYRHLPLRFFDCDLLHRHEPSGALSGLLRVQKFQQDDAHVFIAEEMIEEEYRRILDLADYFYRIFDLEYSVRLSLRPDDFLGDRQSWDKAESILKDILDGRYGRGGYVVAEREGAFYGPKVDILMKDSLGRSWQMGTIQLDFQLPRRFGLKYVDRNGGNQVPVVIHRAIYGSLDRFIGILLEHRDGSLPVWLSPVQVAIVNVSDRHSDYCLELERKLKKEGISCAADLSNWRVNQKVREAELMRIPYIIVAGDREVSEMRVMVRKRGGGSAGSLSQEGFIDLVKSDISAKR